jgi:hypothetical protein
MTRINPDLLQRSRQADALKLDSLAKRHDYKSAVGEFMRTGEDRVDQFTLTTGTRSGAMLPKEVLAPLSKNVAAANPFRAAHEIHDVEVIQTDGVGAAAVPLFDATAGAEVTQGETLTTRQFHCG